MAITFTGYDDTPSFTVGESGQPFPKYSIDREDIFSGDSTLVNTVYTINVRGVLTTTADATTAGVRQNAVQGKAIQELKKGIAPQSSGLGILTITPVSGDDIVFNNAKILSVNVPEASDTTQSMTFQEYSFSFEAYKLDGDYVLEQNLESVEESWDISESEGVFAFANGNVNGAAFKVYTLSHTVSATAKYDPSVSGDSEGWRQAVLWVKTRLENFPTNSPITDHIDNEPAGSQALVPFYLGDIAPELGDAYRTFNPVRDSQADVAGGNYSVTDTWVVAPKTTKATHTIDAQNSYDGGASATVTISGEIQGLNTYLLNSSNDNKDNKFTNAESEYDQITPNIFEAARNAYDNINRLILKEKPGLNPDPIAKSVGQNKTTGVITYSQTYTDLDLITDKTKVAFEDVNVSYENRNATTVVYAAIPVLDREEGPVIQKFSLTDNPSKVSVSADLVMKPDYRTKTEAINEAKKIVDSYKPANGYVSSYTENWDELTGTYNLSIEWTYK